MKTLAVILHYNTPQYTDVLYELLESEQKEAAYDLVVIDNNSDSGKESKYTTYKLDENVFFGGGLNASMDLMMQNEDYSSLLFLNSDLIVGKKFVGGLKASSFSHDVSSPCIIQPEKEQNHWKQMLPWGSNEIRDVQWVDLQCPLISRKFVKYLWENRTSDNYIDPLLLRGWGIEIYFGILAKKGKMQTGVCDNVPAVHLGSMTMKALGNTSEYCHLAEHDMYEFFNKNELIMEFIEMRKWSENYKI